MANDPICAGIAQLQFQAVAGLNLQLSDSARPLDAPALECHRAGCLVGPAVNQYCEESFRVASFRAH